jgi:hypothetical protein
MKTIILSLLIIIVLNFILHYIKDAFTEPIIRYIDKPKEVSEPENMKKDLTMFLNEMT